MNQQVPDLAPAFDIDDPADTDFNHIRDLAFLAIRKHVPCDKPPLIYGCERAECICAEAACDVAGAVSGAISAERRRVIELKSVLNILRPIIDAEIKRGLGIFSDAHLKQIDAALQPTTGGDAPRDEAGQP